MKDGPFHLVPRPLNWDLIGPDVVTNGSPPLLLQVSIGFSNITVYGLERIFFLGEI